MNDLKNAYVFDDKCLGSGSFGKVFLATNKADPSIKIAVKQITTKGLSDDDLEMLNNEIKIM